MPKTFDSDWMAYPHATGVLEQLLRQLQERQLPEPCAQGVVPGAIVAFDYIGDDCDSFAWARVTTVYPSTSFPEPLVRHSNALQFAVGIEVGLLRRAPLEDNGVAPASADLQKATRLQMADMYALLAALTCHAGDDIPIVVGGYVPIGPDGGVVGGQWTATFGAV